MSLNKRDAVKILKSLANPRRLQILLYLRKYKTMNVSAMAEKLDLSFRSTSKHLLNLENAGLIERKQQSSQVFYSVSSGIPMEVIDLFARISE